MMNIIKSLPILIIAFLGSTQSFAGSSWVGGGGGDVIGDHANPWFLQNTQVIHTCIIVDPEYFHVGQGDTAILKSAVNDAQEFWREEFKKSFVVGHLIPLATQTFDLLDVISTTNHSPTRSCPSATDVTYQFGYASNEQQTWLHSSDATNGGSIATTVRTEYDPVHMKGKGFILLSADSGPLAMRSPSIVPMPWQHNPVRLTEVLKHELGHVYGLQHRGIGPNNVMAIDYPDTILSFSNQMLEGDSSFHTPPFFGIEGPYIFRDLCDDKPIRWGWRQLLKAPLEDRCTKFIYAGDEIEFFSGPSMNDLILRGVLKLERDDITRFTWEDAIRVFVTDRQTAIKIPENNRGEGSPPLFIGPMIKINERHGKFYTADHAYAADIEVRFNPSGIGFSKEVFRVQTPTSVFLNLDFEYGPQSSSQ